MVKIPYVPFQSAVPRNAYPRLPPKLNAANFVGLKHNAGQLRFETRRAQEDAETVKLMRESGAIPLVVTNTPELCMMIETYNKINGTTNNPYDLRRTPSGSSGGEVRENRVFLLT